VLVADQGLNSATNIVALVLVARVASLQQFGVFATTYLGVLLGQSVAMAALCDRWLQADSAQRVSRFATGLTIYCVAAAVLVGFAALLFPFVGINAAIIGAAAVPAIAGLDYVRTVLFAVDRPWAALAMDAAYGGLQLLGIAIWTGWSGSHGGSGAWLAWAVAAYLVFGVFACGAVRVQPFVERGVREPIREAVGLRYGAEMLVVNGSWHVALLIMSTRLGVAFNGLLRATSIPFGPLVVLAQASRSFLIPLFRAREKDAGRRLLAGACVAYSILCGACTVLTYVITQSPRLRGIIGGIHPAPGFVLLTGLLFLTNGLHLVVFFYFRARRWDGPVLTSRVVLVAALIVTTAASVLFGSSSTFLILASGNWVVAAITMLAGRVVEVRRGDKREQRR